jgi:hypothetical protein
MASCYPYQLQESVCIQVEFTSQGYDIASVDSWRNHYQPEFGYFDIPSRKTCKHILVFRFLHTMHDTFLRDSWCNHYQAEFGYFDKPVRSICNSN